MAEQIECGKTGVGAMTQADKYSPEWGINTGKLLFQHYASLGVDFTGKRVLDFGCHWGYFLLCALEAGALSTVGVDVEPHWIRLQDQSILERANLQLMAGDLLELPAMQDQSFDLIVSSGTLFLLDSAYVDRVLAWFYDHIAVGGYAVLRTRCVTGKSFNDLGNRLRLPGAQLLFSRRIINQIVREKGFEQMKAHLAYTGATWIMACYGAGFEVMNVVRASNGEVSEVAAKHRAKTQGIDQVEIDTGEITLLLRKPPVTEDIISLRKTDANLV